MSSFFRRLSRKGSSTEEEPKKEEKKEEKKPARKSFKQSNEVKKLYYTIEFKSLGDQLHNDVLMYNEFCRLMILLGYPSDNIKKLWQSKGKPEGQGQMSLDEYIQMISTSKDTRTKTHMWRQLFAEFDLDGTGTASKAEVLQGLEKVGIPVNDRLKATVDKMADSQGMVGYGDFLAEQLNQVP